MELKGYAIQKLSIILDEPKGGAISRKVSSASAVWHAKSTSARIRLPNAVLLTASARCQRPRVCDRTRDPLSASVVNAEPAPTAGELSR